MSLERSHSMWPNVGLAGCGIQGILGAGYGMKLSWRDRDALLFVGGTRDVLKNSMQVARDKFRNA